jgi:hypothetical protein
MPRPPTKSPLDNPNIPAFEKIPGWIERNQEIPKAQSGRHKQKGDRMSKLAAALERWKSPDHDEVIGRPHREKSKGVLPHDELQAAIQWECFRHLYFSGKLRGLWKELIENDQLDTLERHTAKPEQGGRAPRPEQNLLKRQLNIGPMGWQIVAGGVWKPFTTWADHPHFPSLAWMELRELPTSLDVLIAAPKRDHVKIARKQFAPNTDALISEFGKELETWRRQNSSIEVDLHKFGKLDLPEILEASSAASAPGASQVILEIDWNSTKSELVGAFWREIGAVWQKRNPQGGAQGRRDKLTTFFGGLVMRRRLDRGLSIKEAGAGLYSKGKEVRTNEAAKAALAVADEQIDRVERFLNRCVSELSNAASRA